MSEYQKMMRYAGRVFTLQRTGVTGSKYCFTTELSTLCRHCDELAMYRMVGTPTGQTNTATHCECLPRAQWISILISAAVVLTCDGPECNYIDARTLK